jgi:hypothetical protein
LTHGEAFSYVSCKYRQVSINLTDEAAVPVNGPGRRSKNSDDITENRG